MLFAKLLVSPMPHGRVRRIDTSAAEAMPGVAAILTADDLPAVDAPNERALTNEPLYEGEPILAVAAVDETTAADAIERIAVDLEPLPFVLDPLDSLRPGGPNARLDGNTMSGTTLATIKWDGADWPALDRGELPADGPATSEWDVGDVAAGFAEADLILDETVSHQSMSHQPLETRSAMAYWQGGKCYLHASTQSTARTLAASALSSYPGVRKWHEPCLLRPGDDPAVRCGEAQPCQHGCGDDQLVGGVVVESAGHQEDRLDSDVAAYGDLLEARLQSLAAPNGGMASQVDPPVMMQASGFDERHRGHGDAAIA